MAMQLNQVVPFGRSLDEYRAMFSLSDDDLGKEIVCVADGPASFNAEMWARGKRVISVDPLYLFSAAEIEQRFYAVVDGIMQQVKETPNDWVWTYHQSPEQLQARRVQALTHFLTDYERGKADGRYVIGELPRIDCSDGQFELALCSHFLFLYSDHFSYEFHREALFEMLRIAVEVRVFPLLTLALKLSPYLAPLLEDLANAGYVHEIRTVSYELQRGGNRMLCIKRADTMQQLDVAPRWFRHEPSCMMWITESVLKDLVPYWKTVGHEQIVDEGNVITADGVTPSIDLGHYVIERSAEPATLARIETDRRSPKCRYAVDARTLLLH